ncbi:MAG TPA: beta-propeller fold lactonase family protein [Acidobacteriaceae bacterium]|nr:beta-propeller fold lactonase family protein [Acidobacteriaceae bacterium]
MKWTRFGQGFLATAASLGLALGLASCNPGNTIDYLFVTSNTSNGRTENGKVTSYHVNSYSGVVSEVTGSPFDSQGKDPVAVVATPNQQYLYVANHDSNNVAEFAIGTNGQLSGGHTYTTPGVEPVALAVNNAGTLLFVVDYYQSGFSDATPGPGGLVVYPIHSDGTLGSPVGSGSGITPLQCFPGGVAVTANGSFVYVTNTNSVIVTTTPPSTATNPATPSTCPAEGTISGFSIASGGSLTALPGSPYAAGSTPTGIAIDPTNRFVYSTDSVQNQLIAYQIQPGGSLYPLPSGPFQTGTFPVSVVVDPRGQFIYVTNYNSSTVSEYSLTQSTGAPSAGAASVFNTRAPYPTCLVVEPALGRYVYTTDFTGASITGAELNPHTGELTALQDQPYPANGSPTCAAAIPHGNHATQYVTATGQ